MVPDNTVHKGTSKRHKTDENSPILRCTFLHKYLIYIYIYIPLHPAPFQKYSGRF